MIYGISEITNYLASNSSGPISVQKPKQIPPLSIYLNSAFKKSNSIRHMVMAFPFLSKYSEIKNQRSKLI